MRRISKRLLVIGCGLVGVVAVSSCSSSGSPSGGSGGSGEALPASKNVSLRIGLQGVVTFPSQATAAFATEQGTFTKANLKVTWVTVQQVSDCARAVQAGSLDACMVESFGAANALHSIPSMKLVAQLTPSNLHYLVSNSTITSVQQLKGKNVGAGGPTSVATVAGKNLVKTLGGSPDGAKWVAYAGTAATAAAFTNKQVDAAVVVEPFQSLFPTAHVLGNTGQATPTALVLLAKPSSSAAVQEGIVRFLKVNYSELNYIVDPANKAAVVRSWTGWVKGINPSVMSALYDNYVKRGNWTKAKQMKFAVDMTQWAQVNKLENLPDPAKSVDQGLRTRALGS